MRIGQDKQEEPKEVSPLTEVAIRQKIKQHGDNLKKTVDAIQKLQGQLKQLYDQQLVLQGAIRSLQDLLPQNVPASDLSNMEKDVPDEAKGENKDENTAETEADVPQVVNPVPVSDS